MNLRELLQSVIYDAGKPITGRDIALAINRPNGELTSYDRRILKDLAAAGKIEVGELALGPVLKAYTYQRKENGNARR